MGRCDKPCVCLVVDCGYSIRHSVTSSQGQCGAALAFKGKALLGGDDVHVCSRVQSHAKKLLVVCVAPLLGLQKTACMIWLGAFGLPLVVALLHSLCRLGV